MKSRAPHIALVFILTVILSSSCMRRHIDAFYSTKHNGYGGNSIELSRNGDFKYVEWNDYGWGTKGSGTYSIQDKNLI